MRAISGALHVRELRAIEVVDAEYLEAAFTAIAERHGSLDGYLRDVLGADDTVRGRLRDVLVET